ncbi:MAG: sporulation integral membrane protein YlbJ [Thermacetogeniaceae bacterium]|nr:sporulation integral membrane protein YlbJ [Syntrophomonadaceae bacterium]
MLPGFIIKLKHHKSIVAPGFFSVLCLLYALGVISYPSASFEAAQQGLKTWWEIVLPSLLPFFIIAELLIKLGFVAFLGTLLEPAMRPLFNLPGCSGFIMAVSYLSGFPLCAILTSKLHKAGLCDENEGERLLSFTSNASPLFMIGAVGIGMYQNPVLGPLIAAIHYLSNFICGLILKSFSPPVGYIPKNRHVFKKALHAFIDQTELKNKGFGKLLKDTILNSCITILTIGGFITFFSVLAGILRAAGFFSLLLNLFQPLAQFFALDRTLLEGIFMGFFEITIGIQAISSSSAGLLTQLLAIEALLAWNGLAIQAQVTGMVADSGLKVKKYYLTRLLQIPLAMLITVLVFLLPLQEMLAVPTSTGIGIPLLVWAGILLLLSAILAAWYLIGRSLIKIISGKVIIIR